MSAVIEKKYDFIAVVEVVMSNPNGDPDAGNYPRVLADGRGVMTSGCIKRKIRNYVHELMGEQDGFGLYVADNKAMQPKQRSVYKELGIDPALDDNKRKNAINKKKKEDPDFEKKVIKAVFNDFFDIRWFGAAMTGLASDGISDNQLTGPVQISESVSVGPINVESFTITRCAPEKIDGGDDVGIKGARSVVSYGVYRVEGHVNATKALRAGFTEEDLELLWDAILHMFENDYSSARGCIGTRKLYIFEHASKMGNANWVNLRETIEVKQNEGVDIPTSFEDYTIKELPVPEGVTRIVRG